MSEDLRTQAPERFLRLAVERGGLELEEVKQNMPPQVARALELIAGSEGSGLTRSGLTSRGMPDSFNQPVSCAKCGHWNRPGEHRCRHCGEPLESETPQLTLDDLVAQGLLTAGQAQEAMEAIQSIQNHYTAGTRYSVFGASQ